MTTLVQSPRLLNHIAWTRRWRNRRLSVSLASSVVKMARDDSGLKSELGLALRTLAWQAKWRGEMDAARGYCQEARDVLQASGPKAALADVQSILGIVHLSQFRFQAAEQAISQGFALLDFGGPSETRIDLMTTQASFLSNTGRTDDAGSYILRAQAEATGIEQARVHQNMARFHLGIGDMQLARAHASKGILLSRLCNNRVVLPYLHELLGSAMLAQGKEDLAQGVLEDGMRLALEDGDKRVECHISQLLGQIDCMAGRTEQALARFQETMRISERLNYPTVTQEVLGQLERVMQEDKGVCLGHRVQSIARVLEKARQP